jgi:MFS family permease
MQEPAGRSRVDTKLLFLSRMVRMFAYGFLAVVLGLYLDAVGFNAREIGLLVTLTLAGDTIISLALTTSADRFGRRRTLLFGAFLMAAAGFVFASTNHFWVLVLTATIGVISPSGGEVGPFLAVEQAALSQAVERGRTTAVLAWYNLAGSLCTAMGALTSGALAQALQAQGMPLLSAYRAIVVGYGGLGLVLAVVASMLSPGVEIRPASADCASARAKLGLGRSRAVVLHLSALFALDAFAGGLVVQSLVAYWFHVRFGVEPALIGAIFFGANLLAGVSALAAARLAKRFGLLNTMVFTHLPSNVLLVLVPFMPTLSLVIFVFLLRFSLSQMDVPTRQAYMLAVVSPEERSAAGGVANVARTIGASASPALAGLLLGSASLLGGIFVLAGGLKVVYDLLLLRSFRTVHISDI